MHLRKILAIATLLVSVAACTSSSDRSAAAAPPSVTPGLPAGPERDRLLQTLTKVQEELGQWKDTDGELAMLGTALTLAEVQSSLANDVVPPRPAAGVSPVTDLLQDRQRQVYSGFHNALAFVSEGCVLVGHSLDARRDAGTLQQHAVDLVQRGGGDIARLTAYLGDDRTVLPEPPHALGGGYRNVAWGSPREALDTEVGRKSRSVGRGRLRYDLDGGTTLIAHIGESGLEAVELKPKLKTGVESQRIIDELLAKYGKPLSSVESRGSVHGTPSLTRSFFWTDGKTRIRYVEEEWVLADNVRDWHRAPTITYSEAGWGREAALSAIRARLAKLQKNAARLDSAAERL